MLTGRWHSGGRLCQATEPHLPKGDRNEAELAVVVLAILGGGSLTLLALVRVGYDYGNQPSVPVMELAAGLGAALGGALTLI